MWEQRAGVLCDIACGSQEEPPACLQFNLEVEEVEDAAKALDRWRRETGLPMVLEVREQDPFKQVQTSDQRENK